MLFELLVKEGVLVALMALLGLGPAVALGSRTPLSARLALSPAFGLAAGPAVLLTVNLLVPLKTALWWLYLPLAIVSTVLGVRALHREGAFGKIEPRTALCALPVVLLAALVLGLANRPLDQRLSQGPMGWGIFDAVLYVPVIDGYQNHTTAQPLADTALAFPDPKYDGEAWGPTWDIAARFGWASTYAHTGAQTVAAIAAGGLGFASFQMQTPMMIALLLIGALATFALVVSLAGPGAGVGWAGALAGAVFAGPAVYQVLVDGSAGLLSLLALVPAMLAVGIVALRRPAWRTTVLFGLLLAGLQANYPEFWLAVSAAIVLTVVLRLAQAWRSGLFTRVVLRTAVVHTVAVFVLALVLSPRSALWLLDRLIGQATGSIPLQSFLNLIEYNMRLQDVVPWLLGLREFYDFSLGVPLPSAYFGQVVLPLVLVAIAAYGVVRTRWAVLVLPLVVIVVLQALSADRLGCSYCVQRSVFALEPILAAGLALGLVVLWRRRELALRAGGVVLLALFAVLVAGTTKQVQDRTVQGAYMAPYDLEAMTQDLRDHVDGTLEVEGFSDVPYWAWMEQPVTYQAARETTGQRISTIAEYNDNGGFAMFITRPRGHPVYTPGYKYVLSRFGALDDGRGPVIARHGPLKLERRATPFDVSPARGINVDSFRRDRLGEVWLQAPGPVPGVADEVKPTFWISATTAQRAFMHLRLTGPPDLRVRSSPGTRVQRGRGGVMNVCVPVQGREALRVVTLDVTPFTPPVGGSGNPIDPVVMPAKTVRLDKAVADRQPCATGKLTPAAAPVPVD